MNGVPVDPENRRHVGDTEECRRRGGVPFGCLGVHSAIVVTPPPTESKSDRGAVDAQVTVYGGWLEEHRGPDGTLQRISGRWERSAASTAARDARVRETLASVYPILGARCTDAQSVLFDYSIEERDGRMSALTEELLLDACEAVLRAVHDELMTRAPGPLDPAAAFELDSARRYARHALRQRRRGRAARELELSIADGVPLAICVGSRKARVVRTYSAGTVHVPASGCYAVFPDSIRATGGRMAVWCPACKQSRTQRGRSAERSHFRFVEELAAAHRGRLT